MKGRGFYGAAGTGQDLSSVVFWCHYGNHNRALSEDRYPPGAVNSIYTLILIGERGVGVGLLSGGAQNRK